MVRCHGERTRAGRASTEGGTRGVRGTKEGTFKGGRQGILSLGTCRVRTPTASGEGAGGISDATLWVRRRKGGG